MLLFRRLSVHRPEIDRLKHDASWCSRLSLKGVQACTKTGERLAVSDRCLAESGAARRSGEVTEGGQSGSVENFGFSRNENNRTGAHD